MTKLRVLVLCFPYFTDISINLSLNKTAAPNKKMLKFLQSSISLHEIAILANPNFKIFLYIKHPEKFPRLFGRHLVSINTIAYGQFCHYKNKYLFIFLKLFHFSIMKLLFFHPFETRIFLIFVTFWMYILTLPT